MCRCCPSSRRPEPIDAFDAIGEAVFAPTPAAILGAEDLALPRGAIDPRRIGRALRDDHQGALHRDAVVEALPAFAEIAAAVERALVAHRGDAQRRVHRLGIVPRHLDVARIGQGREAADAHLLPMQAAVGAAEEAHAVGEEYRAGARRVGGERMGIHHPLGLGVADDAAAKARLAGEVEEASIATLPALAAIAAPHDAADFEPGIERARIVGVAGEANDAAGEARRHHALGFGRRQLLPRLAAVAAAIDGGPLRPDIKGSLIAWVEQDRPDEALLSGQGKRAPALAAIAAPIRTRLRPDIDHLRRAGPRRDAARLDAIGKTGGEVSPLPVLGIKPIETAGVRLGTRRDPWRRPDIDIAWHFRPLGHHCASFDHAHLTPGEGGLSLHHRLAGEAERGWQRPHREGAGAVPVAGQRGTPGEVPSPVSMPQSLVFWQSCSPLPSVPGLLSYDLICASRLTAPILMQLGVPGLHAVRCSGD